MLPVWSPDFPPPADADGGCPPPPIAKGSIPHFGGAGTKREPNETRLNRKGREEREGSAKREEKWAGVSGLSDTVQSWNQVSSFQFRVSGPRYGSAFEDHEMSVATPSAPAS